MLKSYIPPACSTRLLFGVMLIGFALPAQAQFSNKWLSAGSLHNWYSEVGSECEECGFVRTQQDGMRWPGIYRFRDMQAAKGIWLAATNVTDDIGTSFPFRVVHVGPRVSGAGEFFPQKFELVGRFEPPLVTVDGGISEPEAFMVVDRVDPDILPDRMLVNEVNTLLGLTMERRIMQFSQEYHDNYHVMEYIFTNTGNVDDDPDIELPNQTLEGVYIFPQWRWSVAKETRYIIGNGTGWGKNAMNDARGDGVLPDPPGEDFRAQFSWHGNFPEFTLYDNIGAPIMPETVPAINVSAVDTLGRLGASAFVGHVTLHADASASDESDDPAQPTTTTWFGSDDPFTSQNDAFNPVKLEGEYRLVSSGHKSPRHANVVEPSGLEGFLTSSADPSLGTPGGISHAAGFGPYTIAPGEDVRIVIAEAAAGLSREENIRVGMLFRDGVINARQKNEIVFQGRDSLFQTFRRAQANLDAGFDIPRPPLPPFIFEVNSGGDRIALTWETFPDGPTVDHFEIYRASGRFDSTYTRIHMAGAEERGFEDTTPIRGIDYYYYITAVGSPADNSGAGDTPGGRALASSRYYTQTYTPARLKRQAGENMSDIRIVPNPFNIGSNPQIRWPDQTDKLGFLNIPGTARIEIYTELGELVDRIEHTDGSGDEFWDHTTSSRQIIASGIYIAVITNLETGEQEVQKFMIIR